MSKICTLIREVSKLHFCARFQSILLYSCLYGICISNRYHLFDRYLLDGIKDGFESHLTNNTNMPLTTEEISYFSRCF